MVARQTGSNAFFPGVGGAPTILDSPNIGTRTPIPPVEGAGSQISAERQAETGSLDVPGMDDSFLQETFETVRSGIPQGLTTDQRNLLFSRLESQNRQVARNATGQLAARFGGNVSDPRFIRQATNLQASAGSRSAAARADIDIQESQRNQELEQQRRNQMIQLSGLQGQLESTRAEIAARLRLGQRGLDLQQQQLQQGNAIDRVRALQGINVWDSPWGRQMRQVLGFS